MKEKLWCEHNKNIAGAYSKCEACNPSPQPEEWETRLKELLNTTEHKHNCIGYSEGQTCCLEKEIILSFITSEIRKAEEESYELGYKEGQRSRAVDFAVKLDEDERLAVREIVEDLFKSGVSNDCIYKDEADKYLEALKK